MKYGFLVVLSLFIGLWAAPALAQDDVITGVEIRWPLPVTEVWGTVEVTGSAAVSGMAYYYLEYLPLNDDFTFPDSAPWIPATIGIESIVTNGELATLDTTGVPDGLYALRLVVNTRGGQQFTDTVTPIRVNNERFSRVIDEISQQALADAGVTPTEEAPVVTPAPTREAGDTTPRVMPAAGITSTNVRRCDVIDNHSCAVLGFLNQGQSAEILALSANGSGWFQVRLASGLVGWVSPTVVEASGDLSNLPRAMPATPLPPATAPNVIPNAIAIENNTAVCGRPFNAQINVANVGNATSPAGVLSLQNVHIRTGTVTFTNYAGFPSINPGGNFLIVMPLTVSVFFNEDHELRAFVGNQQLTLRYRLQQGSCGIAATLPPPPTMTPTMTATLAPPTELPPTEAPPVEINPGRDFLENECSLNLTSEKSVFDAPNGNSIGVAVPGSLNATRVELANNVLWYRLVVPDVGQAWLDGTNIETQGNCGLN